MKIKKVAVVLSLGLILSSCGLQTGIDTQAISSTEPQTTIPTSTVPVATTTPDGTTVITLDPVVVTTTTTAPQATELIDVTEQGSCLYNALEANGNSPDNWFIEGTLVPYMRVDVNVVFELLGTNLVDAVKACPGIDGGLTIQNLFGEKAVSYAVSIFVVAYFTDLETFEDNGGYEVYNGVEDAFATAETQDELFANAVPGFRPCYLIAMSADDRIDPLTGTFKQDTEITEEQQQELAKEFAVLAFEAANGCMWQIISNGAENKAITSEARICLAQAYTALGVDPSVALDENLPILHPQFESEILAIDPATNTVSEAVLAAIEPCSVLLEQFNELQGYIRGA